MISAQAGSCAMSYMRALRSTTGLNAGWAVTSCTRSPSIQISRLYVRQSQGSACGIEPAKPPGQRRDALAVTVREPLRSGKARPDDEHAERDGPAADSDRSG